MTRFDEWLRELERATDERSLRSNPAASHMVLWLSSHITVFDIRKYKFIHVGPKGRFAVAIDGTIYDMKNNDVNKKVNYGNINTFEDYDWSTYYPTRKSLYDWQKNEAQKSTKKRRKTTSRPVVEDIKISGWPYSR